MGGGQEPSGQHGCEMVFGLTRMRQIRQGIELALQRQERDLNRGLVQNLSTQQR